MLTFVATSWLWIVLIGTMAVRHLGHRTHGHGGGGGGGCGHAGAGAHDGGDHRDHALPAPGDQGPDANRTAGPR